MRNLESKEITIRKDEEDKKMENKLDSFFEVLLSSRQDLISPKLVAGFFLGFAVLFMLFPWQVLREDDGWLMGNAAIFFAVGTGYCIYPYTKYMENQKQVSVFAKLRYYPADMKIIRKYLLKKTEVHIRKVFWAALVLQLLATLIGYHTLTIANLLYVVVVAYIWPMLNAFNLIVLTK